MDRVVRAIRGEQGPTLVRIVTALGVAAFALFLAAVLGALSVSDDEVAADTASSSGSDGGTLTNEAGVPIDPLTGQPVGGPDTTSLGTTGPAGTGPGGTDPGGTGPGSTTGPGGGGGGGGPSGEGSREGVSAREIKWGVHAPETFDGAPINLAEDPIKGIATYTRWLNDNGGVNGRKIVYRLEDDRYNVPGAKAAANRIMNEYKPFFVSGTLGVDQVAVFAAEASKRGIPYLAAGGSERLFKNINMFQVAASYDTHLIKLAEFLGKETATQGSPYFGRKKIGVTALDSPYLLPSVTESFKNALQQQGLQLVKVVTVIKPTEQTTYQTEITELRSAGVEILVPAQDPITTSRMVKECSPATHRNPTANCPWRWSFSNFAHESDVALQLMTDAFTGVRGLAGGCYYQAPGRDDPAKCAQMGTAHQQWVKYHGEGDWNSNGSGGAAGYQIVHIWLGALKAAGSDPTRERFRAALLTYEGYSDLVSSPITYKGSANLSHGSERMVVLEAQPSLTYRQMTPGFVDSF